MCQVDIGAGDHRGQTAGNQREFVAQVDTEDGWFRDPEERGQEGGNADFPVPDIVPVQQQVAKHRAALAHQGHRHQRVQQVDTEDGRFRDPEERGQEGGNADFPVPDIVPVQQQVAKHRAALAHQGHRHQRVQEVGAGIRNQLGFNGTEDVVQAGDDNDLLDTREEHVAEDTQVFRRPDQAGGDPVGERSAHRSDNGEEKQGGEQHGQQGRYQQLHCIGDLLVEELVEFRGDVANHQGNADAALEAHEFNGDPEQAQGLRRGQSLGCIVGVGEECSSR